MRSSALEEGGLVLNAIEVDTTRGTLENSEGLGDLGALGDWGGVTTSFFLGSLLIVTSESSRVSSSGRSGDWALSEWAASEVLGGLGGLMLILITSDG